MSMVFTEIFHRCWIQLAMTVPPPPPRYRIKVNPEKSIVLKLMVLFCNKLTTVPEVPVTVLGQISIDVKTLTILEDKESDQIQHCLLEILAVPSRLPELLGTGQQKVGLVGQFLSRSILFDKEPGQAADDVDSAKCSHEDSVAQIKLGSGAGPDLEGHPSGHTQQYETDGAADNVGDVVQLGSFQHVQQGMFLGAVCQLMNADVDTPL